jgi:NADPH:quinone reductase-like Zn-dependent oxidoreductase
MMKAIVQDRYGPPDALAFREIDVPEIRDDEVLVRVRATSVHPDVWHMVRGLPYVLRLMGGGLRRPKRPVPGTDVAGQVAAVGRQVDRFQPGDEVFGETVRGYTWTNGGAFAEYVAAEPEALALKPATVTFEQAAAVPSSGLIALHNLRGWARPQPGQRVLVNGAGGGVGVFAVQLARAYGAHVTGVDHPDKLELVRSVGADRVIDYTKEDFTRGGGRYDLIFDIPGNRPYAECRRALTPQGRYVLIGHDLFGGRGRRVLGRGLPAFARLMPISLFTNHLPKPNFSLPPKQESMAELKELLGTGKLAPVIDRTYPLRQVPEAIRYLETGQVRGKIVITV